jgi:hypothetical protein
LREHVSQSSEAKGASKDAAVAPVSRPGDPREREADRAAHAALSGRERPSVSPLSRSEEQSAPPAAQTASRQTAIPTSSSGAPLEPSVCREMESRFGHDFSRVRVHDDTAAAAAASAMGANAYTYGRDIVFDAGRYAPATKQGRELIAHELAHVVQQRDGASMIQREDKPGAKEKPAAKAKVDVSIVLSEEPQDMAEGRSYAKTVLRVTDVDDAAAKLKALGAPVGTLYVVSHSNSAGQVQFNSSIGTISWVPIRDLAKALKGAATIDSVDFRGCKMGEASGAMESFRQTLGAQSVRGTNCWSFVQRVTPLTYDGVEITSPSQIPEGMQAAFDKALLQQIAGLVTEDKKPVQNCLVGLAPGEKPGTKTLGKIWQLYWANQGNLVASWASPEYNKNWQKGSICTKDMTATTSPCAIVETKAPAPPGGAKQGAAVVQNPQEQVAEVEAAPEAESAPEGEGASPTREEEA